ncbi:MAG: CHASE2 domain-containing protein [Pseudomonas sp.]|nr:CHASE2 domain-containing protein [Pseudomonas sp.]
MIRILQQVKLIFLEKIKYRYNNNLTDSLFRKFFIEWLFISILSALLIISYASSDWNKYSYMLYDNFAKLIVVTEKNPDDIVVIAIDEKSIGGLGRWPWSRVHHSQLINQLQSEFPKVLAFNILFTELENYKDVDFLFKEAISKSAFPIVLPILKSTNYSDFYFSTENTLLSTVDIEADADGVIRGVDLIVNEYDNILPQLSLQAYWGASYNEFYSDYYSKMLINYNNNFKEISYKDVLDGNYPKEYFKGKIVLVGVTAAALGDRFVTPKTTAHSSVHVHAQILSNIIKDNFIYNVKPIQDFYISFFIVFIYLIVVFLNKKIHISYVVLSFSTTTVLISILFLNFNIWWSPISCIIAFFASWVIWNWRRSAAVIGWCRHSLNYFQLSKEMLLLGQHATSSRSIMQDRFQFELNILETMLVSAKKIETQKEKLRTYLSHDLRTPKASMIALINAQKNPKTAIPEDEFYERMQRLITKSLGFLEDLLVLSRSDVEFLKLEPILLAAVVQDALDYLWPQFLAYKIKVNFNTESDELGEVLGDAKLLLRAFANILENSIKYAGENATITIDIKKSGAEIILTISDDGPGFNSVPGQEISSNGSTEKAAYSSYGLGLELVKTVVKAHNATLCSQSSNSTGAVFIFKFPAPNLIE